MADSNITKRALASALKAQLKEEPFSKISISDICERCEMNRKSFYYHFKDKYDLVNWIFDTEFAAEAASEYSCVGDYLSALSLYLYENRDFYRYALRIEGQNEFAAHFHETLRPIIAKELKLGSEVPNDTFRADIICDFFVSTFERWITQRDCIEPTNFMALTCSAVKSMAEQLCGESK